MRNSKINRPIGALSIIAAALALSGVAWAGDGEKPDAQAMVTQLDVDGDGNISEAEHSTYAQLVFEQLDADDDGNVTATELDNGPEQLQGDEVALMLNDELARASAVSGNSMATTEAPDGSAPNGSDASASGGLQQLDSNGDSMVSVDEYVAAAQNVFSQKDGNGDAMLSADELSQGHSDEVEPTPYE